MNASEPGENHLLKTSAQREPDSPEDGPLPNSTSTPTEPASGSNAALHSEPLQATLLSESSDSTPFQRLDPRYVTVEQIEGWIVVAVVAMAALIGFAILAFTWSLVIAACVLLGGVVVTALLVWANFDLPHRSYRAAAWRLSPSGLEIHRGIWWKHEITVPRSRVQHVDVAQGPLLRQYSLAKVTIHTAGTVDASVELAGLAMETAQWLRGALTEELSKASPNSSAVVHRV